ncbi:hypothetical protein I7I53_12185 [Histoplasma capsulatum var. duboisii H88]|uniref:Uncharacterized protein n=1 Tax=Ajellomyces capsulatus (strain H88) TaxID=544711 RepID=A0A8A1LVC5_AJEC8|nr:hypothetical protein I7I53_12185 [Histoplasma capsulatum var. duboisii H88]
MTYDTRPRQSCRIQWTKYAAGSWPRKKMLGHWGKRALSHQRHAGSRGDEPIQTPCGMLTNPP